MRRRRGEDEKGRDQARGREETLLSRALCHLCVHIARLHALPRMFPHSAPCCAVPMQRCSCRGDAQASCLGQRRAAACSVSKRRHPLRSETGARTDEEADEEREDGVKRRKEEEHEEEQEEETEAREGEEDEYQTYE